MATRKVGFIAASVLSFTALLVCAQPVVDGDVLTTKDGLTLYVFDNDAAGSGKSVCNPPCSGIFPPYLVEEGAVAAENFSIVLREDGSKQWAYKGKPLYRFFNDQKRGDKIGDGMNRNIWHVARL